MNLQETDITQHNAIHYLENLISVFSATNQLNYFKGRNNKVTTAKDTPIQTHFALVDIDQVIASHTSSGAENPNYPQELQPRDRSRDSSQAWVQKTAANINPDNLGKTGRADTGAPIVGPDMVVESGNGRVMALKLAYERGTIQKYLDWLIEDIEYFGFSLKQLEQIKKPILVRVRDTEIDRIQFTIEANQDDKLKYTDTEQAKADAKRIDDNLMMLFMPNDSGDFMATSNFKFLTGFLAKLGDAESAQYLDNNGQFTQSFILRVKKALFAKAYNDDRLIEMMADQSKPIMQNMINALSIAAPQFVNAQSINKAHTEDITERIVDGIEASLDKQVLDTIIESTNAILRAKQDGQDVSEFIKQQGLFEELPLGVAELAIFIDTNNRSAKKMAIFFEAMATYLENQGLDHQNYGLFGEPEPASVLDAIQYARQAFENEYPGTYNQNVDMFDSSKDILSAMLALSPIFNTDYVDRLKRMAKRKSGGSSLDHIAQTAQTSALNQLPEPTEQQKIDGTYYKPIVHIMGLKIAIENPAGSMRTGTDSQGKKWQSFMPHHYGYIVDTLGFDGDELDIFIKNGLSDAFDGDVYIIKQTDPETGEFDEHKLVIGADTIEQAKEIYLSCYESGWDHFSDIYPISIDELKNKLTKTWDAYDSAKDDPIHQLENMLEGLKKKDIYDFLMGEPVVSIPTGLIKRGEDGKVINQAKDWMRQYLAENRPNGIFIHPQIGEIQLSMNGVKNSLSHMSDNLHLDALATVPIVLENSKLIKISNDNSDKPIRNYFVTAPVTIHDMKYVVILRIRKNLVVKNDLPNFYIVSIDSLENIQKNTAFTHKTQPVDKSQENIGGKNRLLNILHEALNVNIDKNGFDSANLFSPKILQEVTFDNAISILQQMLDGLSQKNSTDIFSDKTTDENYRWKDTGYIPGARKELAQMFTTAKKEGRNLTVNDIDWDEMAQDTKMAESLIKKENVLGTVDWLGLRDKGMPSNVAYFIKRVYAAVDKAPLDPMNIGSQKNYVKAISNLRDELEKLTDVNDVISFVKDLSRNITNSKAVKMYYQSNENLDVLEAHSRSAWRIIVNSTLDSRINAELGEKFYKWLFNTGNKALTEMRTNKNPNKGWSQSLGADWAWAEKEPKVTNDEGKEVKPKKKSFQLEHASHIERIGGKEINLQSSAELEKFFGFRAIQSGNYVLNDKSAAEFHMQSTAEAMSDMSDILGIAPEHLGLNGNLAMSFGARGKRGALAHYEPSQRVINITKMRGGGSLGHEYFHALDNLINDLDTQKVGSISFMGSNDFNSIKNQNLAKVFKDLYQNMVKHIGGVKYTYNREIDNLNEDDIQELIRNLKTLNLNIYAEIGKKIDIQNDSLESIVSIFDEYYPILQRKSKMDMAGMMSRYFGRAFALRHHYKKDVNILEDGSIHVPMNNFISQSDFYANAISLDQGKVGKYWSSGHEMAARAFTTYLIDKLASQGRKNDYLAYTGLHSERAFPQGDERKKINEAFDQLFQHIRDENTLGKASNNVDLMDNIFGGQSVFYTTVTQ